MKAITVRCPDCGAQLKADRGLTECTYCGTSIMIEGQNAQPSPSSAPTLPEAEPAAAPNTPAILLVVSLALIGLAILGFVMESAGSNRGPNDVPPTLQATRGVRRGAAATAPEPAPVPTVSWEANAPVLEDVNGDGVVDMVTFFEGDEDQFYASILGGADGKPLWMSDGVPGLEGGAEPRVFLSDAAVLATGSAGDLTGYSLRDGGTLWTIRLAEVVDEIADLGEKLALVKLKDGSRVRIDLERGAILATDAGDEEVEAWIPSTSDGDSRGGVHIQRAMGGFGLRPAPDRRQFEEFKFDFVIWSGEVGLCIGKRDKGTEVPMIVRFQRLEDDDRGRPVFDEVWRATVPGVEPLKARLPLGFATFFHTGERIAAVAYVQQGISRGMTPSRIAGFDVTDGRRLWDQEIPEEANLTSLTVRGDRVYIVTWKGLTVLDGPSGEVLFAVDRIER